MATNIGTSFDTLYLSSHLPEKVFISTDARSVTIKIYVDADEVFSSVYYPFNGNVTFRDLRSIVEAAIYDQALDVGHLMIEVSDGSGQSSVVDDVLVINSSYKTALGSETFLATSFLTTRKSAVIPRSAPLLLQYFERAYSTGSNYYMIHYTVPHIPDTVLEYKVEQSKYGSSTTGVVSKSLPYDTFKGYVDTALSVDCTVLFVEIYHSGRQFSVFYTDEQPTEQFTFINAFNMTETAYLYAASVVKTEIERSEAVCGRQMQFYDENVTTKHEVETAALMPDEALWLNQLFTSKYVTHPVGNGKSAQVLISDITSEVTDSDKEQTRLKFCWRYADGNEWM